VRRKPFTAAAFATVASVLVLCATSKALSAAQASPFSESEIDELWKEREKENPGWFCGYPAGAALTERSKIATDVCNRKAPHGDCRIAREQRLKAGNHAAEDFTCPDSADSDAAACQALRLRHPEYGFIEQSAENIARCGESIECKSTLDWFTRQNLSPPQGLKCSAKHLGY
jgi:hypothetical protein